jgi:hypothetical protein
MRDEALVVKGTSKGIVFCAAARSTIIIGIPAVRTATGTTHTTSTITTGFVFVFPTSLQLPEMRLGYGFVVEASMMAG